MVRKPGKYYLGCIGLLLSMALPSLGHDGQTSDKKGATAARLAVVPEPAILLGDEDDALYSFEDDWADDLDDALVGDTASLVGAGSVQVTMGSSYAEGQDTEGTSFYVSIEYGLTDWLEIGVSQSYGRFRTRSRVLRNAAVSLLAEDAADDEGDTTGEEPSSEGDSGDEEDGEYLLPEALQDAKADNPDGEGWDDVSLSISVELLDVSRFLVSASVDVSLPSGDDEITSDHTSWDPSLSMDVDLDDAALAMSIGGSFESGERDSYDYSLTFAYDLDSWVPSLGISGTFEEEIFLTPGVGFEPYDGIECALEIPLGTEHGEWGVSLDVSLDF